MMLPCHEVSPLSSPAWQPWRAGRQKRRFEIFFDCASACAAKFCSASVATATAGIAIAVQPAVPALGGNNAARQTAAISRAIRVVKTIATVSECIGNGVRKVAGLPVVSWFKHQDSRWSRRIARRVLACQSHPA